MYIMNNDGSNCSVFKSSKMGKITSEGTNLTLSVKIENEFMYFSVTFCPIPRIGSCRALYGLPDLALQVLGLGPSDRDLN